MREDLKHVDVSRATRCSLERCIDNYVFCGGSQVWRMDEVGHLQSLVRAVLGMSDNVFGRLVAEGSPDRFRDAVAGRVSGFDAAAIEETCYVLTMAIGVEDEPNES